MKRTLFLILLISVSQAIYSQEIISSQGDTYSNLTGGIDFTLGEPVIDTYQNENSVLTQGFHQTNLIVTNIMKLSGDFKIFIKPNPVKNILKVHIEDLQQELTFEVFDINSKFLLQKKIINEISMIDFTSYKSGSYILLFRNDKNIVVKTFKIQKTH